MNNFSNESLISSFKLGLKKIIGIWFFFKNAIDTNMINMNRSNSLSQGKNKLDNSQPYCLSPALYGGGGFTLKQTVGSSWEQNTQQRW